MKKCTEDERQINFIFKCHLPVQRDADKNHTGKIRTECSVKNFIVEQIDNIMKTQPMIGRLPKGLHDTAHEVTCQPLISYSPANLHWNHYVGHN